MGSTPPNAPVVTIPGTTYGSSLIASFMNPGSFYHPKRGGPLAGRGGAYGKFALYCPQGEPLTDMELILAVQLESITPSTHLISLARHVRKAAAMTLVPGKLLIYSWGRLLTNESTQCARRRWRSNRDSGDLDVHQHDLCQQLASRAE
jgi:hypothetical protein